MKKFIILGLVIVCFLLFVIYLAIGCGRVVPDTTTTTTITTTTSTSTTSTSSTTSTTTTTWPYEISGTITYPGEEDGLIILAYKDQIVWGDLPAGISEPTKSVTAVLYAMTLEAAGNYYVVASDYHLSQAPAASNYVGAWGWLGTSSIETAGDMVATLNFISSNVTSVEVDGAETVNFDMHQIVVSPYIITGTISRGVSADSLYNIYVTTDNTEDWDQHVIGNLSGDLGQNLTISFSVTAEAGTLYLLIYNDGQNPTQGGGYGINCPIHMDLLYGSLEAITLTEQSPTADVGVVEFFVDF